MKKTIKPVSSQNKSVCLKLRISFPVCLFLLKRYTDVCVCEEKRINVKDMEL